MFGPSFYEWIAGKLGLGKSDRTRARNSRRRPPPRNAVCGREQLEDRACPSGLVTITANTSTIPENSLAGAMIQASGTFSGTVIANWESVPGTASAGSDYTHASGSVQLTQGMSFANVYVQTLSDAVYDPNETFQIVITSVTGDATLGSPASAQFTIQDSEPPGGGGGGGQPTSLSVTSPGTLSEGQQFNLHASVSPPGTYWISGTVNWGTSPGMGSESFSIFTMSDGQFWLPHQYYDDGPSPGNGMPSDNDTITVTVGSLVETTSTTVVNVAPVGSGFDAINATPLGGPVWRVEGFLQDVLPAGDSIDVTIDWGDSSEPTVLEGLPSTSSIYQEHTYAHNGQTYTVQVTAEDDDTG